MKETEAAKVVQEHKKKEKNKNSYTEITWYLVVMFSKPLQRQKASVRRKEMRSKNVFKGKESSKPRSGSDIFKVLKQLDKAAFPLLPTPPASKKITTRNILKPVILLSGRTRPSHNNRL